MMAELLRFQAFAQQSYTTDYWNKIILEFANNDETIFNQVLDQLNSAEMIQSEWETFLNSNILTQATQAMNAMNSKTNEGNTLSSQSGSRFKSKVTHFPSHLINRPQASLHIYPPPGYTMDHLHNLVPFSPLVSVRDTRKPGQSHKNEVVYNGRNGWHRMVKETLDIRHEIVVTTGPNFVYMTGKNNQKGPGRNYLDGAGVLTVWRKP